MEEAKVVKLYCQMPPITKLDNSLNNLKACECVRHKLVDIRCNLCFGARRLRWVLRTGWSRSCYTHQSACPFATTAPHRNAPGSFVVVGMHPSRYLLTCFACSLLRSLCLSHPCDTHRCCYDGLMLLVCPRPTPPPRSLSGLADRNVLSDSGNYRYRPTPLIDLFP